MANAAHLSIFKQGLEDWNHWRSHSNETPDLSDLDFSIQESFLSYVNSDKILDYSNINLSRCILNNSIFSNCIINYSSFRNSRIENGKFESSNLEGSSFDGCEAIGADFSMAKADFTQFKSANLTNANLSSATFKSSSFQNATFKQTFIIGADFSQANFSGVDHFFSGWETNFWGTPTFPDNYPSVPIESIYGLSPHTKKILSDGIYLKSKWTKSTSCWKRFQLRLWGISCGYGQEPMRWVLVSLFLVLFFSLIYINIHMNIATFNAKTNKVEPIVGTPDFITAFYYSIITFVTLGYGDIVPITTLGRIVAMIEVCIGYMMLGGLVSIFSNKLARLS